jgi:hypothetical protein
VQRIMKLNALGRRFLIMGSEMQRVKIREPRPDQYVEKCHFSKTGWAIWNKDGVCTCVPANKPKAEYA